jgi:prevent-host-death family protein
MSSVGIRELKNNLDLYLAAVQKGEEIVVTEHGKPVAKITGIANQPEAEAPQPQDPESQPRWYKEMVAKGLLRPAVSKLRPKGPPPMDLPGKPLSEIIIEDRG